MLTELFLIVMGVLLMAFSISLPEIGLGILAVIAGATHFTFRSGLLDQFING